MSTEGEAPRRLRAGDVIDAQQAALMAALTKSSQGTVVEITRNAKGDFQFSVKVAHDDPNIARDTAMAISDQLEERYPYGVKEWARA